MSLPGITVYVDRRWPARTGIGRVQAMIEHARPTDARIVDLKPSGPVASPLSPASLAWSLLKATLFTRPKATAGVFFSVGFVPPLLSTRPVVVVVHDLIHLTHYGPLKRVYYNLVLRPLYRRCERIICVSEETRRALLAWSGIAPSRIAVIHNGVDAIFTPDGEGWDGRGAYVLYVGNHRPYKNLARLVEAYARSSLPGRSIRLFLTGPVDPDLIRIAAKTGAETAVHFLGSVDEADLPRLYRGARAVAFVSLAEGFGLPIVEAMACGVPVMTSAASAMPEIAGGAALLVDPLSVDAIAHGLDRITVDDGLRARLVRAGLSRARDFSHERAAAAYWRLLDAVARQERASAGAIECAQP